MLPAGGQYRDKFGGAGGSGQILPDERLEDVAGDALGLPEHLPMRVDATRFEVQTGDEISAVDRTGSRVGRPSPGPASPEEQDRSQSCRRDRETVSFPH